MTPILWFHPLASYCHKVLIALYENATRFDRRQVDGLPRDEPAFAAIAPLGLMPVWQEGDRAVAESSVIIEYLDRHHPGPRALIPDDAEAALEVRYWDRVMDLHVSAPMQQVVSERLRPDDRRDPWGAGQARQALRRIWPVLEARLGGREWLAGDFSLADCAAAPALFFASVIEPFDPVQAALAAYRDRLLARPSVARTYAEARPWLKHFPFAADLPAAWAA